MLKSRFSLSLCRTYATRRPEKPPARFPDPLNNTVVTPLDGGKLSFIQRPPPTAPSPYSTTLDPASPLLRPPTPTGSPLPPFLRPSAYTPAPTRLSRQDLEKLRALRRSDPNLYSCGKLAKMFGCRPSFVSQVAALPRSLRRVCAIGRRRGWARSRRGGGRERRRRGRFGRRGGCFGRMRWVFGVGRVVRADDGLVRACVSARSGGHGCPL
ncbi:hypothetical protein JVT61DRAFT_979 [Boletus reticuloceps]|uniref:Uncharacterized protein n=1 Tax=Boletus reticuloceps TaxID=495285 RepID=A0A8I2YR38_9AGAM|nr:hypothetical protein JVT61DRAFT_979 [Boletus reticuloceps]